MNEFDFTVTCAGMTPYQVRAKMMGVVLDAYRAIWDAPVPVVALVRA